MLHFAKSFLLILVLSSFSRRVIVYAFRVSYSGVFSTGELGFQVLHGMNAQVQYILTHYLHSSLSLSVLLYSISTNMKFPVGYPDVILFICQTYDLSLFTKLTRH